MGVLTQPLSPLHIHAKEAVTLQESESGCSSKPKSLGISPLVVMDFGPHCSSRQDSGLGHLWFSAVTCLVSSCCFISIQLSRESYVVSDALVSMFRQLNPSLATTKNDLYIKPRTKAIVTITVVNKWVTPKKGLFRS